MNFAFGSSFGRTALEAYAYGAAFGFADILKVAAPIVVARSLGNRNWGAAMLGLLVWGTFTVCSAVSAIGFASANRTFAIDTRTVQAALNQSRLASLEADQTELRRLRDRLASPEVGRSERIQLAAAAQRLEAAIGTSRGKLGGRLTGRQHAQSSGAHVGQAHRRRHRQDRGRPRPARGAVGGDGRVGTVHHHEPCEGSARRRRFRKGRHRRRHRANSPQRLGARPLRCPPSLSVQGSSIPLWRRLP